MTQLKERIQKVVEEHCMNCATSYQVITEEGIEDRLYEQRGFIDTNKLSEAIATDPEIKKLFKESDNKSPRQRQRHFEGQRR